MIEAQTQPLRLLIVDDDDVDREAVRRMIDRSDLGAEVEEADGAMSLFGSDGWAECDCILLDFHLADSDGLAILEQIRSRAGIEMPPVVMLTGAGNESIAAEAIKRGGYDYLVKDGVTTKVLERSIIHAMERKREAAALADQRREIERLGFYDSVTGLPNRNLYLDRLEQTVRTAARTEGRFAVLAMDLDEFKQVNDRYGHHAGDELLKAIGERLARVTRESDTVARVGGDEFAAILPTADSVEGAVVMAEKIESAIREPVLLEEGAVAVGVSIGIVLYPDHGSDSDSLLRCGDIAMYEAKRQHWGHNVFESPNGDCSPIAAVVTSQLSHAMERGELLLEYQPKISFESGRVAGLEALVRWNHPHLGLLSPMEFLPCAERMALITPLTFDILAKALSQLASWRSVGLDASIAVNLSARLLDDEGLADSIDRCLTFYALPPQLLTLEITETGLMTSAERAIGTLSAIQALGVRLSIDDFGSGYTSLKQLMTLPISELKVDQHFVGGVADSKMESVVVASIVQMARGFNITVVAEGVESAFAWYRLSDLGCHQAQGYYIARPMPSREVEPWLTAWRHESSDFATARRR